MRRIAACIAAIAIGVLAPATAPAQHQGCYVYGEVFGLDVSRECTYTATSDTQTVHVATPNAWRIWVLRFDEKGNPVDVTLAEGHGPDPSGNPVVDPLAGETVHVEMIAGCDVGVLCGTIGLIEAGMTDGHA